MFSLDLKSSFENLIFSEQSLISVQEALWQLKMDNVFLLIFTHSYKINSIWEKHTTVTKETHKL